MKNKKMNLTLEDLEGFIDETPLNSVEEIKAHISKIIKKKVHEDPVFSFIDGVPIRELGITLEEIGNHLTKNITKEILETLQSVNVLFEN